MGHSDERIATRLPRGGISHLKPSWLGGSGSTPHLSQAQPQSTNSPRVWPVSNSGAPTPRQKQHPTCISSSPMATRTPCSSNTSPHPCDSSPVLYEVQTQGPTPSCIKKQARVSPRLQFLKPRCLAPGSYLSLVCMDYRKGLDCKSNRKGDPWPPAAHLSGLQLTCRPRRSR